MKIKKTLLLFFALITALCFSSCGVLGLFGERNYHCDADKVESVYIVELGEISEGVYLSDDTVIAEITDVTDFVNRLNGIDYSINSGEPTVLNKGDVVIRINYRNGDYELINYHAQSFYRDGKWRTGYFFFDKAQFDSLIADNIE